MNNIWMNLGIEDYSFFSLAQKLIPECEYKIFKIDEQLVERKLMCLEMNANDKLLMPRFHYVTNDEEKDIFQDKWNDKKQYEIKELPFGFYFPDCPLCLLGKVLPGGFDKMVDAKIEKYFYEDNCLVFNKRLLYRAVFIVLHEYGHYISYKRFGGDKVAYARHVYSAGDAFRELEKELQKKRKLTANDLKERLSIYRSGEEEKFADDYAMEHLEEAIQIMISILLFEQSK